jgi:cytochrome c-type biogenesis protein CcmH/NrfG
MMLRTWLPLATLLLIGTAQSADSSSALQQDTARCQAGNLDACYDAIRWNPRDPALLVGLGDVLARAGRAADAIRNYRRAAGIAPNFPGLTAKINLVEARMSAKRVPRSTPLSAANNKTAVKQFSNVEPESQSH